MFTNARIYQNLIVTPIYVHYFIVLFLKIIFVINNVDNKLVYFTLNGDCKSNANKEQKTQ